MAKTTINSQQVLDGSIVNADVNAAAAIAGTKVSPDFGSQTVQTSGSVKITSNAGLYLGRLTDAQETTLVAGLVAGDGGTIWFNTTDLGFKGWTGSAVVVLG